MIPQVNKEHYFKKKYDDLNRFISYFYQIDLVNQLRNTKEYENTKNEDFKILEVGKGNGTVSDYLRKLDYQITTVDIDPELKPDQLADIRKLPFKANAFDLITAYEVLEHLPFEELETVLKELKRVSQKYVIISLPYRSTGFEFIFKFPLVRSLAKKSFFDIFLRIPLKFGGFETSGQHWWEIDGGRYSLRKLRRILSGYFKIVKEVRPPLNYYHYFFVLEKNHESHT